MAFMGSNGCFMGVDEEGDIVCKSKTAGPAEIIQVSHDIFNITWYAPVVLKLKQY